MLGTTIDADSTPTIVPTRNETSSIAPSSAIDAARIVCRGMPMRSERVVATTRLRCFACRYTTATTTTSATADKASTCNTRNVCTAAAMNGMSSTSSAESTSCGNTPSSSIRCCTSAAGPSTQISVMARGVASGSGRPRKAAARAAASITTNGRLSDDVPGNVTAVPTTVTGTSTCPIEAVSGVAPPPFATTTGTPSSTGALRRSSRTGSGIRGERIVPVGRRGEVVGLDHEQVVGVSSSSSDPASRNLVTRETG